MQFSQSIAAISLALLPLTTHAASSLCTPAPTPTACAYSFPTSSCASSSEGCYLNNGSAGYTLTSCGQTRRFSVHIPSNHNANAASPLVVSYHGRNGNSAQQYNLTELYRPSFNPGGWLSVYPQGLRGENDEPAWQGAPYASGANDTQYTADLLAALTPCFNLNHSAIYATGKSNGGGFVDTLACSYAGGKFAAFSAHSGAFYSDTNSSTASCPVNNRKTRPFLEFHGSADSTIPYSGNPNGANGDVPPIPELLDRWGVRNGCNTGAGVSHNATGYTPGTVNMTSWSCGSGRDGIVQGYWIKGLPHWWASTHPNVDNGGDVSFINATQYIVQFLGRWSL